MNVTISEETQAIQGNSEATYFRREARETNMSRIQNAHFAGFFDSDGYIGIFLQNNKYGGLSYGCEVKIGASVEHKKAIIRQMQSVFGGRTHEAGKAIHLSFRTEEAERFLKAIYPFIILKKPQAALWFKFREMVKHKLHSHDYRHELRQKLMNKINSFHDSADGPQGRPRPDWKQAETLAYAAGLIDGDGSIGLYNSLTVRLSGKPKTLPEWLQNVFGGNLKPTINHQRNERYWEWAKYASEAEQFLKEIGSYSKRWMMIGSEHTGNGVIQ